MEYIARFDKRTPKYKIILNDRLSKLGYTKNTSTSIWTKQIKWTEVYEPSVEGTMSEYLDRLSVHLEIVPSMDTTEDGTVLSRGELRVRQEWELYIPTNGDTAYDYSGFTEVAILDEVMELHKAKLIVKSDKR